MAIDDETAAAAQAAAQTAHHARRMVVLGMLCMAASAVLFTAGNAIIRYLAPTIPPVETVFFRSAFSLVLLLPFVMRAGFSSLKTKRPGLHFWRGALQVTSMLAFFQGLATTPLVEANAIEFTSPIFATVFAVMFMGEKIHIRRIAALLIGFAGAMIALRPGLKEIGIGQIYMLVASIIWAGALLLIRELGKTETALTQSVYMGLLMTPVSAVLCAFVWVTPSWFELALLLTVGATATLGQLLYAQAFRWAEMGAVLPLDFSKLFWSALIGWMVFADIPDLYTVIGAAIIFGAGAYITLREARLSRRPPPTEPLEPS
ncbi:MAG TPA: DMT family transporter [Micropepsaceae bacterium]|nr:DMT family transporter [Micropepsaceae bacterium]